MSLFNKKKEESHRCLFIGLPNSGKSSFIGALWHVVESGEIKEAFTVVTQPNDREYLNILRDCWLGCVAPERTKTEFIKKVELQFRDNDTLAEAKFIFPDLSGETYELQFEHRKLTEDYVNSIRETDGIILFVNPDFLKKSNLITDAQELLASLEENEDPENVKGQPETPIIKDLENNIESNQQKRRKSETEWNSKMAQSQVVLIDLLQMIANRIKKPCKLGIIISAWDLIKNSADKQLAALEPSAWFDNELPMFRQFLISNPNSYNAKIFGVSAQGASYKGDVSGLQSKLNQSERIRVQVGSTECHDITIPIKWLMNG